MKAILLAAVLALPACAANADPLPDAYLGRWCYGGYDEDKKAMMYDLVATKKEWKKCREGDGYMEIKRTGYSRDEEDCTFISVKHAPKIPNTVPVVRIVAQCGGEGATWRDHIELSFFKKLLQTNSNKPPSIGMGSRLRSPTAPICATSRGITKSRKGLQYSKTGVDSQALGRAARGLVPHCPLGGGSQ